MKAVGTRELRTQRLLLRKLRLEDAEALFKNGCLGDSVEQAHARVGAMLECADEPLNFHWVLEYRGEAVGRIRAWDVSSRDEYAQLGYEIGEAFRSKGLMTEAVRAVCGYLLKEAGLNRIFCMVREGNGASIRVCEKAGMIFEGVMRRHFKQSDGTYTDVRIYGLLASELFGTAG